MTRNSAVTENTKLPFGKHKRKRLRECPDGYLRWVGENLLASLSSQSLAA